MNLKGLDSVATNLEERIRRAKEAYDRLAVDGMVEEAVFLKALRELDAEPEALLNHLIERGKVFRPREGWIRWIS